MFTVSRVLRSTSRRTFDSANHLLQPVMDMHRAPHVKGDTLSKLLTAWSWSLFAGTYLIVANWLYQGHVDLWHGVYGIEDDDEDDD